MLILDDLRALDRPQRAAFTASLLGWTLDAFDYFLLVFTASAVAHDFRTQVSTVSLGLALTLMLRPAGAFAFGWLADRFGRRPVLMADVLLFTGFELATAFAPSLGWFLVLRALFGFAMGGEWGIGASLALESVPAKSRGVVSGVLQEGYALGYLLAALVNLLSGWLGWRGLFMVGALPALLVLYIRAHVPESPAWEAGRARARARAQAAAPAPVAVLAGRAALWKAAGVQHLVRSAGAPLALGAALLAVGLRGMTGPACVALAAAALLATAAWSRFGKTDDAALRSHLRHAAVSIGVAVAVIVVSALLAFSLAEPLAALGAPRSAPLLAGAGVAGVWLLLRGQAGWRAADRGRGVREPGPESFAGSLLGAWPRLLYAAVLMTAFNLFSHGTQDLYPTFLKVQHGFGPGLVSTLAIVGNLGAILGGLLFGALSERWGRRRAITVAALLALPAVPLWSFGATPLILGLGAFALQVTVQGAWGVVPAHLNELAPDAARGTFPGFAYQLGNLVASGAAVLQAGFAESRGNDYGAALALTAGGVAVALAALAWWGPERRGRSFVSS